MSPFDLPVHPVVAHVPVAMLFCGWATLVLRHILARPALEQHVTAFLTIGVLSLPVTIAAGFVDTRGVEFVREARWDRPLIWHMIAGLAATVLLAGHLVWRRRALPSAQRAVAAIDLVWSTAGTWAVVLAGAIAGEMVYGG